MQRLSRLIGFGVLTVLILSTGPGATVRTQPAKTAKRYWIWSPDATLASAPAGARFFRRALEVKGSVKDATIEITCDNHFTLWINGKRIGGGDEWQQPQRFDVSKALQGGKNVLAVEGSNDGNSPAGLLAALTFTDEDGRRTIATDKSWKTIESVSGDKWKTADFDDAKWSAANELAPFGQGPWGGVTGGGKGKLPAKRGFTVPDGFKVETVVAPGTAIDDEKLAGRRISFVNMCFDAKGRLLLSQEGGPILLATEPNKDGVFQKLLPYCEQVTNCQGMCWAHDSLYLVGNGPKGTGLYRCRDTKKADKIDEVELIAKFQGGMGEHGPHAVIHGPDDKLYLVIGNHAWLSVTKLADNSPLKRWPDGLQGPDQGKPGTTEDVLLPRLNDANGHAANIRAPGGTIWRMDLDGKNPGLFAAGFRNQFDAAFNPDGELFTFDSDMEWDVGLPWYRHVRVCHCIPGADFLWRTGAANTPNYYADSLPPLVETGRGSPTGVECYDHSAFPAKYRGALFLCDWSIGTIWVVYPKRDGATYKATHEKFCSGSPMPVSDCAVGPDGALYFTLGGRGTAGSVHRIVGGKAKPSLLDEQPLAAWNREGRLLRTLNKWADPPPMPGEKLKRPEEYLRSGLADATQTAASRLGYLPPLRDGSRMKARTEPWLTLGFVEKLASDKDGQIRATAAQLMGEFAWEGSARTLTKLLNDGDAAVRRCACESLIRIGAEPPIGDLKPLLADKDIFVRTAARLVLQRIDPAKWAIKLIGDEDETIALQAIIALCKIGKASEFELNIVSSLNHKAPTDAHQLLDWLRVNQLAMLHCNLRLGPNEQLEKACRDLFPHSDRMVNREMAIVLSQLSRERKYDWGVSKLVEAIKDTPDDRPQQIHYFYCLRVIKDGWTPEQKRELLEWFESTRTWTGGNSFAGFLQNIFRDMIGLWTPAEKVALLEQFEKMPHSALVMLRASSPNELPASARLYDLFKQVKANLPRANEFKNALVDTIARDNSPETLPLLRQIADTDPAYRITAVRALAKHPAPENYPFLVKALSTATGPATGELLDGLKRNQRKPKAEDGRDFRAVLVSASKLQGEQKWKVVEVLRHWTNGRSFGGEKKTDWKNELAAWSKWFAQAYPKEESLPDVAEDKPPESKWKYPDLIAYLEKDPRGSKGDVAKGKVVFTKANCIKCHKFGGEGEGIGPDLTTLSSRFKRGEVLEAILLPSKVISDQYRSSTIFTADGRSYSGLAAEQGGTITILLQDGSKSMIKSSDVESRYASLVSVMPEKLLDELTKEEIADLFAYMESTPPDKK